MTVIKKIGLMAVMFLFFAGAGTSSAGRLEFKTDGRASVDVRGEGLKLDFNASDQTKIRGKMAGFGVAGHYRIKKKLIVRPDLRLVFGRSLDYHGPLEYTDGVVTKTGTIEGIGAFIGELRILAGLVLRSSGLSAWSKSTEESALVAYTGVGIKYLSFSLGGEVVYKTGARTTKIGQKSYLHAYIPLGVQYKTWFGNFWSFGATAEAAGITSMADDSDDGYGMRGSMELQRFFQSVNFAVEPYLNYWKLPKAKRDITDDRYGRVGTIDEPAKRITETGVAVKLRF